jgi:hypothetical protein
VRQKARRDDFYPSGCNPVVSGEDLHCIALCCPSLQSLHVNVSLKARLFLGGEKMLHADTFATHQWHCLPGWNWLKP